MDRALWLETCTEYFEIAGAKIGDLMAARIRDYGVHLDQVDGDPEHRFLTLRQEHGERRQKA